jgi:hypothetical protein
VDQYYILGDPERGERERGRKLFKEIITKNFPNLGKEMDILIHETQ